MFVGSEINGINQISFTFGKFNDKIIERKERIDWKKNISKKPQLINQKWSLHVSKLLKKNFFFVSLEVLNKYLRAYQSYILKFVYTYWCWLVQNICYNEFDFFFVTRKRKLVDTLFGTKQTKRTKQISMNFKNVKCDFEMWIPKI